MTLHGPVATLTAAALACSILAMSDPAAADPLGHAVTGRVTVAGVTAQSAEAHLFKLDPTSGSFQSFQSVNANFQTGEFTFADLPDGTYRLRTEEDSFYGEWYDDAYFSDEATAVVVAGSDVALPTIDLAKNVYVSGTVTGDGEPVSCPQITWYRQDRSGAYRNLFTHDLHNSDDKYTVALAPGTYKARGADGCGGFRPRWYGGAVTQADAAPIVVGGAARMTIGNIDLKDAPTIVGTLRRPDGTPVRDVRVSARVAADPSSGSSWDSDRSDQQGRFRLQVGGVSTKLHFYEEDTADGPDQWYQSWTADGSPTITLGPDDPDLDLGDVFVQPGATLAGTLTKSGGAPTAHTQVTLYQADQFRSSVFTDRQGRYRIPDLVPGSYKLRFGQEGLVTEFHADSPSLAGATPVTATNATTTTVDAELVETSTDLPEGTDVYGFVTGPGGVPEPGVRVCAMDVPANPYPDFCRRGAVTDVHGRYVFTTLDNASTGVTASHYKLRFASLHGPPGEVGMVTVFSGGTSSYDDADPVPLPASSEPVRFDVEMNAAAVVSGILTTSEGDPPSRGAVHVYDASGTRIREVEIDEDGGYAVGLLPGSYRVLFTGYEAADEDHGYHPYVPVWWNHRDSLASATVLSVEEGEYLEGVDAALDDHMVASSPPTVSGSPTVGSTLSASPGQWNGESPAHFTYSWRRDGSPVGTGDSYVVTTADQGHELRVRVTAEIFIDEETTFTGTATSSGIAIPPGEGPPPPPPPPPAAVTHTSSTSVTGTFTKKKGHRPSRITLRIQVTNSSGGVTPGTVTVAEGTRIRRAGLALVDGRAVLIIKRPARGRHTFVVTYAGSSSIQASTGQVSVRAR